MNKNDILDYLKEHKSYYLNRFGIEFIGIFGSYAKDSANENSDIDILYRIKGGSLSLFKYLKIKATLEEYFKKRVDLVREEILKEGLKKYIQKDIEYV